MNTATINLKCLHGAAQCVSTEETRYYLNGVLLEVTRDAVTYVATDGHILFAYRDDTAKDNTLLGSFIIPAATIRAAKLDAKSRKAPLRTLRAAYDNQLELCYVPDCIVFRPIDGTFPAWRRVVPTVTEATKRGNYNPRLLMRLWKAGELIDADMPSLAQNGEAPALVVYSDPSAVGVIMPIRGSIDVNKPHELAAWVNAPAAPQLAEAAD